MIQVPRDDRSVIGQWWWTVDRWSLGAVNYAKFFAPLALLILGFGAWTFFRQLKLTPLAATLGAVALVFGIPLGVLIAHAIGRSRSFMDFSTPTKLRVVLTPQILGFAVLAIAVVLLFQLLGKLSASWPDRLWGRSWLVVRAACGGGWLPPLIAFSTREPTLM